MNQGVASIETLGSEDIYWQSTCDKSRKRFANQAESVARTCKTEVEIVLHLFANEYSDLVLRCQKEYVSMDIAEIHSNKTYDYLLWVIVKQKILVEEASTDYLTGLPNRRSCCSKLLLLARSYHRKAHSANLKKDPQCRIIFSVILFDLDHFKKINDTYGHPVGDLVLKAVSKSVNNVLRRPTDFFGRYGGEEFVVFTEEDAESAFKLAESIRQTIEKISVIEFGVESPITASFGVTEYNPGGINDIKTSINVLTQNVDKALYNSKHRGRNQVTVKRL